MGMKNEFFTTKIVHIKDLTEETKYNSWRYLHQFENTDYLLVKTGNTIDSKLIGLLELEKFKFNSLNIDSKFKAPFSSVSISSTISTYVIISISEYKNIKDNPMIYSETDSIILPKPLNNTLINDKIGFMKLEYIISKGIFISPKLFTIKVIKSNKSSNENEDTHIVSAGINPLYLKFNDF